MRQPTVTSNTKKPLGRLEFIGLLASAMATTALGIDLMLPAFGDIRSAFDLGADSTAVAGIVTAYFVGLALAQTVWGPVADRFGRKTTLYAGLLISAIGALGSALSPSLTVLYLARFVWGIGSAGPRVMVVSVVRDRFEGRELASMMSFIMSIFILVPVVAPSLGAGILAFASWRWVFAFGMFYAGAVALWATRLPETLDPEHRMDLDPRRITRAARHVVSNRQTLGYTLAMTALFGVFSSYLASSEIIFGDVFNRAELFPLIFGGVAAVMGAAMLGNGFVVRRVGATTLVSIANRAFLAMAFVLVTVAWVTGGAPPLALFVTLLSAQLVLYALIFPNMNSIAMDPMGEVAGMAAAVIGFISIAGGAIIGAIVDKAFDGTVIPFSLAFLAAGIASLGFSIWAERSVTPADARVG